MLLDNKTAATLDRREKAVPSLARRLSVAGRAWFTLYGFASLKHELKQLESARIIFSEWDSLNRQNLVGFWIQMFAS